MQQTLMEDLLCDMIVTKTDIALPSWHWHFHGDMDKEKGQQTKLLQILICTIKKLLNRIRSTPDIATKIFPRRGYFSLDMKKLKEWGVILAERTAGFEINENLGMAEGCGNSVGSMGNEVRKTQRLLSRGPRFNAFGFIINPKEAMEDFKLDQHNLIILIIL